MDNAEFDVNKDMVPVQINCTCRIGNDQGPVDQSPYLLIGRNIYFTCYTCSLDGFYLSVLQVSEESIVSAIQRIGANLIPIKYNLSMFKLFEF